MPLASVLDVANEIGVTPRRVQQMLASGELAGQQLGHEWVIDRRALERLRTRPVGRPWNASSAWALLALANGDGRALNPVDRSRAKRRLAELGLAGAARSLRVRAESRWFYGHPAVLSRLANEADVVRSGISAALDYGVDIVTSNEFEGYLPARRLQQLARRYALDADAEQPNIVLRIVEDDEWPFPPDMQVAPRPVVAVDLLDASDERSRRAGLQLTNSLTP